LVGFAAYNVASTARPVLVADRDGVRAGVRQVPMRWEDIEAFRGSTPAFNLVGERGLSSWTIRSRSGPSVRLDRTPVSMPKDWQRGRTDLQQIMEALSVFPTRFGKPPVRLEA
ncbi:MAG: hypothetical protein ACTHN0_03995, partial [Aquihabitans sp.]